MASQLTQRLLDRSAHDMKALVAARVDRICGDREVLEAEHERRFSKEQHGTERQEKRHGPHPCWSGGCVLWVQ